MFRLVLTLAFVLGLSGPGAFAQGSDPPRNENTGEAYSRKSYVEHIRKRVLEAQKLHREGKAEAAYRELDDVKAEVTPFEDFLDGHTAFWWPDVMIARLKRKDKDHPATEAASAPVVLALDNDKSRKGNTRMEAMLLLAKSLFSQKKYEEAHLVSRGLLREAPNTLKPKWRLEAEITLALAATRSKAPDAAELRANLLDGYLDRENATVKTYLDIWRFDLASRRNAKLDKNALILDARFVYDFIRENEAAQNLDTNKLEVELGRIFAESNDFKRAEPILRAQLTRLEPDSVKYYWAWQNLLAMNYSQQKYAEVLRDTSLILAQLEGKDEEYAHVTSSILRYLALSARKIDDMALFHESIQRSYVELRRVRSANHRDVEKVRRHIVLSAVDPDSFPYAEELGVRMDQGEKLILREDGESVLEEVFAGRAISTGRRLRNFVKGNENSVIGFMNLGLYHGLMGEIGPAEEALFQARELAKSQAGSRVRPGSAWFDIYLAITHVWARDWKPERARAPLERLVARQDLTESQKNTVSILRLLLERAVDDFAAAKAIFRSDLRDFDPREDTSPWGVFRALSIVYPVYEVSPQDADALTPKVVETLEMAGSPKLASAVLPVFLANGSPDYMNVERNFQALAYHVQALSRMLPPGHQTNVIAKISFAYGLWNRGRMEEALTILSQAISAYKTSPWHRADAVGFLEVQAANIHFGLGNVDLAFAIIDGAFDAMDPEVYRPIYWREILTNYVYSLSNLGRFEEALEITEAAVTNPKLTSRMSPFDLSQLLITHAVILEDNKRFQDSLAWLQKAREVIPAPDYRDGGPLLQVMEQTAYLNYNMDNFDKAYEAMSLANDLYFQFITASGTGDAVSATRNKIRERELVVYEAQFAWSLTQQLEAASGAQ